MHISTTSLEAVRSLCPIAVKHDVKQASDVVKEDFLELFSSRQLATKPIKRTTLCTSDNPISARPEDRQHVAPLKPLVLNFLYFLFGKYL